MVEEKQSMPCCANFLARSFFLSFEEELGTAEMKQVLESVGMDTYSGSYPPNSTDKSVPLQDFGRFFGALEGLFDERSCRGLIQRAGRNCFNHLHRQSDPALGFSTLDFMVLPKALKLRKGAQIVAEYFQTYADVIVHTDWDGQELHWRVEVPPANGSLPSIGYLADFFLGFWHEALYFISGGKSFVFDQNPLSAKGQTHIQIRIPSVPID